MAKNGRPTKYTKGIIAKAREYLDFCKDKGKNVNLPKAEGLALYLKVSRDTLYEWAGKYKNFSDILEEINQTQADRVINKALSGDYNSAIAKLLLGKHGYSEKTETDITTKGKPIPLLYGIHTDNGAKEDTEAKEKD